MDILLSVPETPMISLAEAANIPTFLRDIAYSTEIFPLTFTTSLAFELSPSPGLGAFVPSGAAVASSADAVPLHWVFWQLTTHRG